MDDTILENFSEKSTAEYTASMRDNVLAYMDEHNLSINKMAEKAHIPVPTLKRILYVEQNDCKLSTAILLAKAMGITINELTNAGIIDDQVQKNITACRSLPQHSIFLVRWFIKHQLTLHQNPTVQDHKVISVMVPIISNDGLSKASNIFQPLDISSIPDDIKFKVFFGILIKHDSFMPIYSPGDVLLMANDRNPYPKEHVVILIREDIFLAKMRIEDGVKKFYGILDDKYRCDEHDISEILGYVAYVLSPSE